MDMYVDVLPENMEITHVSVNDGTIEGMKHKDLRYILSSVPSRSMSRPKRQRLYI